MNDTKATKTYFDMNVGNYCGLLLERRLGIRMIKLLYRQQQEIKELLVANIDETEVSHWTLAYPNNKQTTVTFFDPDATVEDKMRRVKVFTEDSMIKKCDNVFLAKSMKEAEYNYLEYHEKLEFLREENEMQ